VLQSLKTEARTLILSNITSEQKLFPDLLLPGKPIVKWAGGKANLVPVLSKLLPSRVERYAELFVGGGALFFSLGLPGCLIADSNAELINFYTLVRDAPDSLLESVGKMPISAEFYYDLRAKAPESLPPVERAARFIYLNKTCYNGLYRVNRRGQFNTPFGKRTNVTVLDEGQLHRASELLLRTEIVCEDYKTALTRLQPGDLVYLDPPYLPLGGYSDFNRYTRDFFTEADHVLLADEYRKLADRGVRALLSNSYNDRILSLYEDYEVLIVTARRQINCDAKRRGKIREVIVANYPLERSVRLPADQVHG